MRIIAGEFRSRTLVAPEGSATRPTMDRAREALFNVLSNLMSFEGISVLDLYAGSGALAFEALSRGAARATLVEKNAKAVRAIKNNALTLGVAERIVVRQQEVLRFLQSEPLEPFRMILSDPPYETREVSEAVTLILGNGWLAPGGYCVIEQRSDAELPPVADVKIVRELKAGEARFTVLTHATPL